MGKPFWGRHHEPGRMNEGEQFQQVETGKIGVTKPCGDQWSIKDQQRRIGGRHDSLALGNDPCSVPIAQPATAVAGVKGGQRGQGGGRIHL